MEELVTVSRISRWIVWAKEQEGGYSFFSSVDDLAKYSSDKAKCPVFTCF